MGTETHGDYTDNSPDDNHSDNDPTAYHSNSPEQLAKRIASGDHRAEVELVETYQKSLSFILHRKFWNQPFIDDVLQEAFAAVINSLRSGKLREHKALQSFLRQTAFNIGYNFLRNEYKHRAADLDSIPQIPDINANLYGDIEREDLLAHVRKIIDELPIERDRQVLVRYYYEDEDKSRICEHEGLSNEHFDRVLYRAKQRLKALLQKQTAQLQSLNQISLWFLTC